MSHARQADTLAQIDAIFKHISNTAPGGVLTIVRNGEHIYNKAFGLSSLEYDTKNTTETIFEAGSVSKQFTATAVLLLVEEGKLSLEEDVRKPAAQNSCGNVPGKHHSLPSADNPTFSVPVYRGRDIHR